MYAVRIHEHGGPEVIRFEEVAHPVLDENGVVVQVHAIGVNPFDTYVRDGSVSPPGGVPRILGSDIAGEVAAVGESIETFRMGDPVFATGLGLDTDGAYAELVSVPQDRLAHLPVDVEFTTAAAGSEPITTSLQAFERGEMTDGEVCLIQGATGGVGHIAIQIAKHLGATVIASCHPDRADIARRLGADVTVDYRHSSLASAVNQAIDENGVDVIVETHAHANVVADVNMLNPGGRIVLLGERDDIIIPEPVAGTAKMKQLDLRFMSHMAARQDHVDKLNEAGRLLADGIIEVIIEETYPLREASTAQQHCMRSGTVGKIILEP